MTRNVEKAMFLLEENGFSGDKDGHRFSKKIEDDHALNFSFSSSGVIFVSSSYPAGEKGFQILVEESFLSLFIVFLDEITEMSIKLKKTNYKDICGLEKNTIFKNEIILTQSNKSNDAHSLILQKYKGWKICLLTRRSIDFNRAYFDRVLVEVNYENYILSKQISDFNKQERRFSSRFEKTSKP